MRNLGHRVARWVAVVFVAFVAAAGLGSAGAWLGWRDAGPLPSDQRATEIAAEVLPGATVGEIDRWDVIFGDRWPDVVTRLVTDDEYDGGSVLVPVPIGDIATVRATLERTGWRILPNSGTERLSDVETVEFVTARRDDVEMAVFRDTWTDNAELMRYRDDWGSEGIVFQHPEPALVGRLALAGGIAGALLGGWAALRFTTGQASRQSWNIPAWVGGALLSLPSAAAVSELFEPTAPIPPDVPGAPWESYLVLKLLTAAGVLAWGYAVALRVSWSRRDQPVSTR